MTTAMKKLYILAAGLFVLLAAACNKDNSTGAGQVVQLNVTGLKDTINVYTYRDTLMLTPVVTNENDFDYYWTLFFADFNAVNGAGLVKPDTLARTKDLNYVVLKDPGAYILVFNAKDKNNGVTKQVKMVMNITTLTMNGWYLVKDNGGKTDMDFIYPTGRIDNWIAYFNEGKSLTGDFMSAAFVPQFKTVITTNTTYPAFMLASKNDVAIYRVDNGSMVMNFDNMFFTKPATRKPQAVFQPVSTGNLGFINDGKAYSMAKGTLFGNMPLTVNGVSYSNLSPLTADIAMDLGWDPVRKSIFCYNGATYAELKVNDTNGVKKLQNVNGNLQWMAGYAGKASTGLVLFRNPQDTGYLYKLNGSFGPLFYGSPGKIVLNSDTLKPQHGLMNASVICGNYDVDLIYYAVGSNIYRMDVATATENLQFTLPAGETVTAMQHIKYPEPVGNPAPVSTVNYIAIATYNAGRYKVYLHSFSGTQSISAVSQPSFVGDGRISRVIYMEKGNGTRIY